MELEFLYFILVNEMYFYFGYYKNKNKVFISKYNFEE